LNRAGLVAVAGGNTIREAMITPNRALPCFVVLAIAGGCGDGDDAGRPGVRPGARPVSAVVRHDFGMLRHGAVGRADLKIPLPAVSAPLIPIGFMRDCTCARHQFVLVDRETGEERIATEQPFSEFAVREGEDLILRLELHTLDKEAADHPRASVRGRVVLQEDDEAHRRHDVPVLFEFGIDCPLSVEPFAHLDMGDWPRTVAYRQTFRVRGDDGPVTLSDVRCLETDPSAPQRLREVRDCDVSIEVDGDETRLRLEFRADEDRLEGPFAFAVLARTDLPDGYSLRLPVSGKLVGAIEVSPPGRFSFGRIDLEQPTTRILVITDHDPERNPEFVVLGIVGHDGADMSKHFAMELSEIPGQPRSQHMELRYVGGLAGERSFRGVVQLGKERGGEELISIPFFGFRRAP
jgi:hypothetical protein